MNTLIHAGAVTWLGGLRTMALCDGVFGVEEQRLLDDELARLLPGQSLDPWPESREEVLVHLQDDHLVPSASADALSPLRHWLNELTCDEPSVARFLVRLIPSQCPFARDVTIFGRTILHIPPLCKLNPLDEELMALRFRALCFLEDEGPGADRS